MKDWYVLCCSIMFCPIEIYDMLLCPRRISILHTAHDRVILCGFSPRILLSNYEFTGIQMPWVLQGRSCLSTPSRMRCQPQCDDSCTPKTGKRTYCGFHNPVKNWYVLFCSVFWFSVLLYFDIELSVLHRTMKVLHCSVLCCRVLKCSVVLWTVVWCAVIYLKL